MRRRVIAEVELAPWYASLTLWVNLLSIIAVAVAVSLQLAGQLALTAQEVAVGTVVLAVINAAIRVLRTDAPVDGSPPARRLENKLPGS